MSRKPAPQPRKLKPVFDKHYHSDPQIVCAIRELTQELKRLGDIMSQEMDRLATEVEETKTVIASAVVAFEGVAEEIRRLKNDPAKLTKFADDLDASAATLAAAIPANTPAETLTGEGGGT